jgi:20S proteasome alpha/beta subunit
MLVAGVEEDGIIKLYMTEPYGLYFQYKAAVIGEGDVEIDSQLQKRYKPNISVDDGLKLGVELLKGFLKSEFNFERIDAVYIKATNKRYTKLSVPELKALVK